MTQEKLQNVLNSHKDWLNDEEGGKRADLGGAYLFDADLRGADLSAAYLRSAYLRSADLRSADLSGANLRDANLRDADLSGAYLRSADLSGANLRRADLRGADLSDAYLRSADLRSADLSGANLSDAYLRAANLRGANLSDANLRGADLRRADLSGANLRGADLRDAYLFDADLRGAKDIPPIPLACPSGSFIGWKKVTEKLIQLEIPEDAKRSSATSNKCRCDKAKVLSITDVDGSNPTDRLINDKYTRCEYVVGEMVYPDSFDVNRWNECSHGIHFFIDKQEAIDY